MAVVFTEKAPIDGMFFERMGLGDDFTVFEY